MAAAAASGDPRLMTDSSRAIILMDRSRVARKLDHKWTLADSARLELCVCDSRKCFFFFFAFSFFSSPLFRVFLAPVPAFATGGARARNRVAIVARPLPALAEQPALLCDSF